MKRFLMIAAFLGVSTMTAQAQLGNNRPKLQPTNAVWIFGGLNFNNLTYNYGIGGKLGDFGASIAKIGDAKETPEFVEKDFTGDYELEEYISGGVIINASYFYNIYRETSGERIEIFGSLGAGVENRVIVKNPDNYSDKNYYLHSSSSHIKPDIGGGLLVTWRSTVFSTGYTYLHGMHIGIGYKF